LWGGDGTTWTDKDRLLVQALHLFETAMCPCGCGQPVAESHDPTMPYSREKVVCQARAELDRGSKDSKPEPGELRWASPDLPWEMRIQRLRR
jgi:hypothetical protein